MQSFKRRDFLKTAAMGAASLPFLQCQTTAKRPNIVFIMTDDHASHALSCYGSKINKTPNLDRLAQEGMRFNNCFCTNSICAPSRATILTGKYSHLNGVTDNRKKFDGSQLTFPKLLQNAGYTTAMIGKWHLKSDPTGFDYWNILPGQGKYHDPDFIEMGERKKHNGYVTDIITDLSIDWLKNQDQDKPFLLMYHHKAPHRRWRPDKEHAKVWRQKTIPEPETFNDDYSTRSRAAKEQEMSILEDLTVKDVKEPWPKDLSGNALKSWKYQRYMQDYLACVASVDDNIGRFLDFLDRSGLSQNTIVVYTSDQGFYLGDHGWFDKRFMYEESLRMPLLVRYPGEITPGSINNAIVLNLDFAETFLDYAGVDIPNEMQGKSFRPLLRGKTPADWRSAMYYHYFEYPAVHMVKRHYGIRSRRYKLMHFYYDIDAWELYDLEKDPHELNNVYDDPQYQDVVKRLKKELQTLRQKYGDTPETAEKILQQDLERRKTQ